MKVLFVNSCPRGEGSRTLRLARTLLDAMIAGGAEVVEQDLNTLGLRSIDASALAVKEPLCDARAWDDPFFRQAVQFQQADAVIIAAPYWDLSFPSILKVWVENMWVRNLTFHYVADCCVGLCRGRHCVYVTTSGSPIGVNDWGTGYIRAVMEALGVPETIAVKAEGLDIAGNDAEAILAHAMAEAAALGKRLLQALPGAGQVQRAD